MSSAAPAPVSVQPLLVRRAAVLGAGAMGCRIAALLASAGIPVLLLDLVSADGPRSRVAKAAADALPKAKPAVFDEPRMAALITPGNFDDDLPRLAQCDWVVEAIVEDLDLKSALLRRVEPHLAAGAVLTSNTSGISIGQLAATLGPARHAFFGAHFFNPPRSLALLEVIPTAETDPALLAAFAAFADRTLGRQIVTAGDVPNFIANRMGMAVVREAVRLALAQGLTVEETDALAGPVLGWPRTGIFRLADLIGLDVMAKVLANEGDTGSELALLLARLIERGLLGDKSAQGFYRKARGADGKEQAQALELTTLEYRPIQPVALPLLGTVKEIQCPTERLKTLLSADPAQDRAAGFCLPLLAHVWSFAPGQIGVAAPDAPSIDLAMTAGFGWTLGPFALQDAAGLRWSVHRLETFSLPVSPLAKAVLAAGLDGWYSADHARCYQPATRRHEPLLLPAGHATVASFRRAHGVLTEKNSVALVDLGDGIGCIELNAPKHTLNQAALDALQTALGDQRFAAFVISGDRPHFSAGADLAQLLDSIENSRWSEISAAVQRFQQLTATIKFSPRPVVLTPFGQTLGAGAELALHAAARQAHTETCMGLVECAVGLLPAGGGCKELLLRAIDQAAALASPNLPTRFAHSAEMLAAIRPAFDLLVQARCSTSAAEARTLGLLTAADGLTRNRARLLLDAKQRALTLLRSGYVAPQPRTVPALGASVLASLETAVIVMSEAGYATEHDQTVARKVAHVLAGGGVTAGVPLTEAYLLELERAAFLSLCGETRTQERIAYTLKTGKSLRN